MVAAEETASEGKPVIFIDNNDKGLKGNPWECSRKRNRDKCDRHSPYKEPNHEILQNLTKSPKDILNTEKESQRFNKPLKMVSKSRDTSKYCEFHEDFGHDTNACRELKNQIEEAVRSGKLAHLLKGLKRGKGRERQIKTQPGEW